MGSWACRIRAIHPIRGYPAPIRRRAVLSGIAPDGTFDHGDYVDGIPFYQGRFHEVQPILGSGKELDISTVVFART